MISADQKANLFTSSRITSAATQAVNISPLRSDSPLLMTEAEFRGKVEKAEMGFKALQAAIKHNTQSCTAIEKKLDLADPLACYWAVKISANGELSLYNQPAKNTERTYPMEFAVGHRHFKNFLTELLISMPRLRPIVSYVEKKTGVNLRQIAQLFEDYPFVNADPFVGPEKCNWRDLCKLTSRELVANSVAVTDNQFRVPKYFPLSEMAAYPAQYLFRELGRVVYVKPAEGYSGSGQFVLEKGDDQLIYLTPSGNKTVKILSEILPLAFDSGERTILGIQEFRSLINSPHLSNYIIEGQIPIFRVDDSTHELRLIFGANHSASAFKVIASCARKSTGAMLWNNVSKGAIPMTFADALYEITTAAIPGATECELNRKYRENLLHIVRLSEVFIAEAYKNLCRLGGLKSGLPNMPLCLDLVPICSTRRVALRYCVMELQVPYDGVVLGMEQFGDAGKSRRLNYDTEGLVFGVSND